MRLSAPAFTCLPGSYPVCPSALSSLAVLDHRGSPPRSLCAADAAVCTLSRAACDSHPSHCCSAVTGSHRPRLAPQGPSRKLLLRIRWPPNTAIFSGPFLFGMPRQGSYVKKGLPGLYTQSHVFPGHFLYIVSFHTKYLRETEACPELPRYKCLSFPPAAWRLPP